MYRDLKLENLLLTKDGHCVLTDFGLSHSLQNKKKVQSFSGTAVYLAPEILLDKVRGLHAPLSFRSAPACSFTSLWAVLLVLVFVVCCGALISCNFVFQFCNACS